jgi:hypothetical protein
MSKLVKEKVVSDQEQNGLKTKSNSYMILEHL